MGGAKPLRAEITPAMKVDETAPSPGVRIPSRPVAGVIVVGSVMNRSIRKYEEKA
jgi:hypothetical protein|tara:strand:+ start:3499 stop:3663 length:165 start_codon:yes stop_codon:yes gene_type:complete